MRSNSSRIRLVRSGIVAAVVALTCGANLWAQTSAAGRDVSGSRFSALPVDVNKLATMRVTFPGGSGDPPALRVPCSDVSTHTDFDFDNGREFNVQAGFAETEIFAATYTLPPEVFPITVDTVEAIFGTQGTAVQTTTAWTFFVWDGNPRTGDLVAQGSSDGDTIPHVVIPAGSSALHLVVAIDPTEPPIIIANAGGTNTFSIGFRIDQHNSQTQNPCIVAPPSVANAFPATDRSGVSSATQNWLFAIDCGAGGCRAGWSRFSQLGICEPSGDWLLRSSWSSDNCTDPVGACCLADGSCVEVTQADCTTRGGVYNGDGSACADVVCGELPQACCFADSGGCLSLMPSVCAAAGGVPGGIGTDCANFVCFPSGACCLADGSCVDAVSDTECAALGGVFQGDATTCAAVTCPDPVGACCFDTGFCLVLSEADCTIATGTWQGAGSDCSDGDGDGTADACQAAPCTGDIDNDLDVDIADLGLMLAAFGTCDGDARWNPAADLDGNLCVELVDLSLLLQNFGTTCP